MTSHKLLQAFAASTSIEQQQIISKMQRKVKKPVSQSPFIIRTQINRDGTTSIWRITKQGATITRVTGSASNGQKKRLKVIREEKELRTTEAKQRTAEMMRKRHGNSSYSGVYCDV